MQNAAYENFDMALSTPLNRIFKQYPQIICIVEKTLCFRFKNNFELTMKGSHANYIITNT